MPSLFAARQVTEQHREMQKELHMVLLTLIRRMTGYQGRKCGGVFF